MFKRFWSFESCHASRACTSASWFKVPIAHHRVFYVIYVSETNFWRIIMLCLRCLSSRQRHSPDLYQISRYLLTIVQTCFCVSTRRIYIIIKVLIHCLVHLIYYYSEYHRDSKSFTESCRELNFQHPLSPGFYSLGFAHIFRCDNNKKKNHRRIFYRFHCIRNRA